MRTGRDSADHLLTSTTPHQRMIDALAAAYPELRTKGFMRALAECGEYMADLLRHDPEWRRDVAIVPDAFTIDFAGKHVAIFEVVDTHDIPPDKVEKVAEIGWALDQDGYDIAIIRVDRHGRALRNPIAEQLAAVAA